MDHLAWILAPPSTSPNCREARREPITQSHPRNRDRKSFESLMLQPMAARDRSSSTVGWRPCATSRLAEAIEQRPGQNKRHEAAEHIANPEVREGPVKEGVWIVLRLQREDEDGNNCRAQEVEDETWPGFQTERASRYAKERGCERANVRDSLWRRAD